MRLQHKLNVLLAFPLYHKAAVIYEAHMTFPRQLCMTLKKEANKEEKYFYHEFSFTLEATIILCTCA